VVQVAESLVVVQEPLVAAEVGFVEVELQQHVVVDEESVAVEKLDFVLV